MFSLLHIDEQYTILGKCVDVLIAPATRPVIKINGIDSV
jgi:hypothetical protein